MGKLQRSGKAGSGAMAILVTTILIPKKMTLTLSRSARAALLRQVWGRELKNEEQMLAKCSLYV